jgi:hypothetical protein
VPRPLRDDGYIPLYFQSKFEFVDVNACDSVVRGVVCFVNRHKNGEESSRAALCSEALYQAGGGPYSYLRKDSQSVW